jgi:serine/threonine protein kinase
MCTCWRLKTGIPSVQEAVDVWSLGVMAFELLTGTRALCMLEGEDKVLEPLYGSFVMLNLFLVKRCMAQRGTCAVDGLH